MARQKAIEEADPASAVPNSNCVEPPVVRSWQPPRLPLPPPSPSDGLGDGGNEGPEDGDEATDAMALVRKGGAPW